MNDRQFAQGLVQLLHSYQRAGITRLSRASSGALDLEVVSHHLDTAGSPTTTLTIEAQAPAAQASVASAPSAPSAASADVRLSPSRIVADPAITPSVPPLVGWQLPLLSSDERATRLDDLDRQVKACRKCEELISYRRQTVFGEGSVNPRVCFYGEAPGADEDAQGRPFVGPAGKLLNDIIAAMKLKREEVYILNSLKCRPPQNRTPVPDEVDNCRLFAHQQLEILQPEFLILLGAVAVRSVLQSTESVGRLRGRFHRFHGSRVLVTYHPAYLLRTPAAKKMVWEDVQLVMRELG